MNNTTAILFAGSAYNFRVSLPTLLENVIIPNEADVFILTTRWTKYRKTRPGGPMSPAGNPDGWALKCHGMEREEATFTAEDEAYIRDLLGDRLKRFWIGDECPSYQRDLLAVRQRMVDAVMAYRQENERLGLPLPFAGGIVTDPSDGNIRCLVDQYFHVRQCHQLMQVYESTRGVPYQHVARMRLDFVAPEPFVFAHYYLPHDQPYAYICGSFRRDPFEWSDEFCWFSDRKIAQVLFPGLERMGLIVNRKYQTVHMPQSNDFRFAPETQFSLLLHELRIPCLNVPIYRTCRFTRQENWDYLNYEFRRDAGNIEKEFRTVCQSPTDINEHLLTLRRFGTAVNHITELGTRYGNSTIAFLAAHPKRFITYDVQWNPRIDYLTRLAKECGIPLEFRQENPQQIEPTDLLFIDTDHHVEQCSKELALHAGNVRRYLIFHDVTSFWEKGQGHAQGGGLRYAIEPFMRAHPEWREAYRADNNNGLLVLERRKL